MPSQLPTASSGRTARSSSIAAELSRTLFGMDPGLTPLGAARALSPLFQENQTAPAPRGLVFEPPRAATLEDDRAGSRGRARAMEALPAATGDRDSLPLTDLLPKHGLTLFVTLQRWDLQVPCCLEHSWLRDRAGSLCAPRTVRLAMPLCRGVTMPWGGGISLENVLELQSCQLLEAPFTQMSAMYSGLGHPP